jgi:hypothetical protein
MADAKTEAEMAARRESLRQAGNKAKAEGWPSSNADAEKK